MEIDHYRLDVVEEFEHNIGPDKSSILHNIRHEQQWIECFNPSIPHPNEATKRLSQQKICHSSGSAIPVYC